MSGRDENDVISALTGFSINHVLDDLALPTGANLSNQLGISGLPALTSGQIYSDKWDDDDAVGPDQGQDWEDEIDREMREEEESDRASVKQEIGSPSGLQSKQRRVRVVKRLVERPKTVYERFPAFEKDNILDFSELFKGYTVRKSRLSKRSYQVETVYPRKRDNPKGFLEAAVGGLKRNNEGKLVQDTVAVGDVEADLKRALEV